MGARRHGGVATRLLRSLLIRSDAALALAPVAADNAPAGAAFRSWGWRPAGAGERPAAWLRPLP